MKKLFASFGALILFALTTTSAFAYTDVDGQTAYLDSIDWMTENEVFEGYDDGSFRPDACVQRVEFLKTLYVALEGDLSANVDLTFSDIEQNTWYTPYLKQAVQDGAVDGYPDNTFKPAQCMNRVEGNKMAVLAFNNNLVPDYYSYQATPADVETDSWYYDTLSYSLTQNLLGEDHMSFNDNGSKNFDPAGEMTRQEVAEMLYRMKTVYDNTDDYYRSYIEPYPLDATLFNAACELDHQQINNNTGLLATLPSNNLAVFSLDQLGDNHILAKLLDGTLTDFILSDGDNDMVNVLTDEFEVAVAIQNFDIMEDTVDYAIAIRTDQADELEHSLARNYQQLASLDTDSITCTTGSDFVKWDYLSYTNSYLARSGDFFVVTSSDALRTEVLNNLKSGSGHSAAAYEDDLFYLTANVGSLIDIAVETMYPSDVDLFLSGLGHFKDVENLLVSADLELGGVRFKTATEMSSSIHPLLALLSANELTLANNVPAEDLVFYSESPGLFFDRTQEISDSLGIDVSVLEGNPAAVLLALPNGVPSGAFFVQMDASNLHMADTYNDLMAELLYPDTPSIADNFLENGIYSISMDLADLAIYGIEEFVPGMTSIELHYGLLDNNVYTVAIYPDLPASFGSTVVANDAGFKSAMSQIGVSGSQASYFNMDILTTYLDTLNLEESDEVLEFFNSISSLISSTAVDGSVIESETYLKF